MFSASYIFFSVTIFLFFSTEMLMAYPLGFNLGQNYLSSAYYTHDNGVVPVARVETSEEWRSYYAATLQNSKKPATILTLPEVQNMFQSTLQEIYTASQAALQYNITVNSIVVPQHFRGSESLRLMSEAAIHEGFTERYHQVTHALNGARLAYNLDSCAGFTLKPGQRCNLEDGPNFVLVVEYNPSSLSLGIIDVGVYICEPYNVTRFDEYGEDRKDFVAKKKKADFLKDLEAFLASFAEAVKAREGIQNPLISLQAIVLTGEASDVGMDEMRKTLTIALPEYQDRLRMSLDPHFVGAIGAAQRARHIVQNPLFLAPDNPGYIPFPPKGFREL